MKLDRWPLAAGAALLALSGTLHHHPATAQEMDALLFTGKRDGKQDLYLIQPDGSGAKNLTKDGAGNGMGMWSPDGKQIAYISLKSGNPELAVMDADGSNVRMLTSGPEHENQPSWSPDGKKIAFCRSTANMTRTFDIFVIGVDGGPVTNLTKNEGFDGDPAWSPDGKQILFTSTRGGDGYRLYLMNADGTNPHSFPVKETGAGRVFPAWSADGQQIAFADQVEGGYEIFTCRADGTERKKLTSSKGVNTFPAWSPDGKQLAFFHYDEEGAEGALWITSADGRSQSQVAPTGPFLMGTVTWKPR